VSYPIIGLFVGLLLAIAAAAGGFLGFLLAIVLGGAGYAVGRYLEGAKTIDDVFRPKRRG